MHILIILIVTLVHRAYVKTFQHIVLGLVRYIQGNFLYVGIVWLPIYISTLFLVIIICKVYIPPPRMWYTNTMNVIIPEVRDL